MSQKTPIPAELDRYLRTSSEDNTTNIARYLEHGSALVTNAAIDALRSMLPVLRRKIAGIKDSFRLRQRVEILLRYFEETLPTHAAPDATRRDVTFALFYFLKGYDRIPDSIPEIGLLDDALIVDSVVTSHRATLRLHWLKHGREWPEET
jgi:uncharacterized membrane protein YkvA (DUF1232 family)